MTTNRPEKLDEALIRPGRVDHQVAFSNASQSQIKELFERMYADDLPSIKSKLLLHPSPSLSPSTIAPAKYKSSTEGELTPPLTPLTSEHGAPVKGDAIEEEVREGELSRIAEAFAKQVPGGAFSPAEIQGFLLKRKKAPRKAEREVGAWVEGMKGKGHWMKSE